MEQNLDFYIHMAALIGNGGALILGIVLFFTVKKPKK